MDIYDGLRRGIQRLSHRCPCYDHADGRCDAYVYGLLRCRPDARLTHTHISFIDLVDVEAHQATGLKL